MSERPRAVRGTVLVADDDADIVKLIEVNLNLEGYDVVAAHDGVECIRLASEHQPDVILLDVMMPRMDGREVLSVLSREPSTRDVPVIFLSALGETEDRVTGLESGAVDYITKPIELKELVARVGAAARTYARLESVRDSALEDPVTGLLRSPRFQKRLAQEVMRSKRSSDPLSVMLVDVEGMKEMNTLFGKDAGDDLMRTVATKLRSTLRASDAIFKHVDDELSALLIGTDISTAYLAARRFQDALSDGSSGDHPMRVTIGLSELGRQQTADDLLADAESALAKARETGSSTIWRGDDRRRHGLNPIPLSEELTEREWTVLMHVAQRHDEKEIARLMGIRKGTVRSHKARIRRKLSLEPKAKLADFARDHYRELVEHRDASID
jgi:diguanylate cyclase (GGDEF)-like protein